MTRFGWHALAPNIYGLKQQRSLDTLTIGKIKMSLKKINDDLYLSGEFKDVDFKHLKEIGVSLVINARPDGECEGQTCSSDFEDQCKLHGIDYLHLPVKPLQYSDEDILSMSKALKGTNGKVYGFCRTGARAIHLWALTQKDDKEFEELQSLAQSHEYDLSALKERLIKGSDK